MTIAVLSPSSPTSSVMSDTTPIFTSIAAHRREELKSVMLIPMGSLLTEAESALESLTSAPRDFDTIAGNQRLVKSMRSALLDIKQRRIDKILNRRIQNLSDLTGPERILYDSVICAISDCYPGALS